MPFSEPRFHSNNGRLTPYSASNAATQGYELSLGPAYGQSAAHSQSIQNYGGQNAAMNAGIYAHDMGNESTYMGMSQDMGATGYQTPVSMSNMHMNSVSGASSSGL